MGEWSASRPDHALSPGKGPPVPIVKEAGWAPEPVWTQRLEAKSFRLCRGSNLNRPVAQSTVSHYTDRATRLTLVSIGETIIFKMDFMVVRMEIRFIWLRRGIIDRCV
jgi:hypothetical protein